MNRKFMAMLLVIVMVVSMVPMTAGAAEAAGCACAGVPVFIAGEAATCGANGWVLVRCPDCGQTKNNVTPATGNHELNADGNCIVCQVPFMKPEEPECQHTETYTITNMSSCTVAGSVVTMCKNCETKISTETLPLSDEHVYHNGYCLLCNKPQHIHDLKLVKEETGTCTEKGYAWYECACGYGENGETTTNPNNHDYQIVKEQAPTCAEAGYAWYECADCGAEKNNEVGAPTGEHNYVVVKEQAPTCTEAGYVWKECSVCGAEKNHEEGAPTNIHVVVNGKCEECGMEQPKFDCDHKNSIVLDHKDADCSYEGYTLTQCQDCKATNLEKIAPNDKHNWTGSDNKTPTCTEAGFKEHTCTICGEIDHYDVPATGHNHVLTDSKNPTYLAEGYKVYTCANGCGDTYTEVLAKLIPASTDGYDYVPRTGSAFVEWLYALIFA